MSITFRQTNDATLTGAHNVTRQVLSPLVSGGRFHETRSTSSIHEFLFEMRKDGGAYWVGAAVPRDTSDFTQAHVFFHPTVVQAGTVHAADPDYAAFTGGWSGSLQRYVAMQGAQLAGARQTPLIVPFMTMAALGGRAPAYLFATRPAETLDAILTAVRDAVTPNTPGTVSVARVGVASFSSGIGAMRLFISTFGASGVIAETTDFDSPFIIGQPRVITRSPGAVGRVFSQVPPGMPSPWWITMSPQSLQRVSTFRLEGPHAQIGWMSYYMASLTSVIG